MAFPAQAPSSSTDTGKEDLKLLVDEAAEIEELELERDGLLEDGLGRGSRVKYVPLCDVYSATSPSSKKIKARKPLLSSSSSLQQTANKPPIIHFYSRRRKRNPSFFDSLVSPANGPSIKREDVEDSVRRSKNTKRRKNGITELMKLGVDSSVLRNLSDHPRLRETRNHKKNETNNKRISSKISKHSRDADAIDNDVKVIISGSIHTKRWFWLCYDGADPKKFIGLQCKVYWPLDDEWYSGRVVDYDSETYRHHVKYGDGDEENLILSHERVKFYISPEEMQHLKLTQSVRSPDTDGLDVNEMVVLAASLNDCQDLEPGDVIWAKLTGHAMWPAIVLDESVISGRKGLNRSNGEKSVPVQFFGTHDFARVKTKQIISFLRGLLSSFHLKCKKINFVRSLEEAKMYLSQQKIPKRMLRLRSGLDGNDYPSTSASRDDEDKSDSSEEIVVDDGHQSCPIDIGDLQVISLGKIFKDSEYFRDERFLWPEGYTAVRKFPSITDPHVSAFYKMEVLRDTDSKIHPLFRVTSDNGEQFEGCTPSACWDKIYRRLKRLQFKSSDGIKAEGGLKRTSESGSDMFGFTNPEVLRLVQELSNSKLPLKFSKSMVGRYQDIPVGYRSVHVKWKDLDKCSVCHMDEEYENNLFLQCDKCRMMVHARCYGELEPVDGILWLCNLCRPGAPEFAPPCCLCPVTGGAMKPTTDGRWSHLACAIWIPETCLSDIKKMEPIDGLNRIDKKRWKLLCSICGVSYGACIQCSKANCFVAYHPLCARAAGFCVELEDEDRLHLIPLEEDEDDQCIRLLSFCKKHRPSEPLAYDEQSTRIVHQHSDYAPPLNHSGCARTEPYNYFGRRGRKEPEALAAASLKRLFVENRPYLVGGYCQHECSGNMPSSSSLAGSRFMVNLQKLKNSQLDAPKNILSMAEKYNYMKETFRKRLAFGKSGIHGFGIFAKHPHRAGDMVIEYTGELVRPPIADRRERLIYNSLVGAGTYMFRIDDERVIDATRAGSIAHLINHSCEPNCYSRVISVNGDEHIIIFAKRDIKQWEELTYDYRFFSIDEQLACYCGFPRCRGVVNDIDAEEQMANRYAPRSELIDWSEE